MSDTVTIMLTSRVPRELVTALDREAERLRTATGLPCSRTAALVVTLRRALAGPAVPAVVADPGPNRDVETPKPVATTVPVSSVVSPQGGPRPPDAPAPKAKAKLMGATLPSEKVLRARCRAVPGSSTVLAKYLGVKANTVRAWWLAKPGKQLWPRERLVKVANWLEKQEITPQG